MPDSQDGGSPEQELSPPPTQPSSSTISIPRNRSTGNLKPALHSQSINTQAKRSSSFDEAATDNLDFARSPVFNENERSLGQSGLHRIRQKPTSRLTSPVNTTAPQDARPPSMTLNIPPTPGLPKGPSAPPSPLLERLDTADDLRRFPSESLHSFSFTSQAEDLVHNRQSILKRSIELMRGRTGFAGGGLGIMNAQARVNGDEETQSMMELLNKANLLGNGALPASTDGGRFGPTTGPAQLAEHNVFENSFMLRSQSPETLENPERNADSDDESEGSASGAQTPKQETSGENTLHRSDTAPVVKIDSSRRRSSLKRTYTDTAPLNLQSKLSEAMSQPYLANENILLSSAGPSSVWPQASAAAGFPTTFHAHGRAAPVSQAIFTTQNQAPWTITAANDLACLTLGVTKAEVKKIGILEMVREDKRKWLETKLRGPSPAPSPTPAPTPPPRRSPSPGLASSMKNGVTAKLLSKPSSRESSRSGRRKSDDSNAATSAKPPIEIPPHRPRGVILCGDVIPIIKRNGTSGSASLWVQEKRNNLIWVLEEIAEDVALLSVDEIGSVTHASGQVEAVWGMERVRRGMDIIRLLPGIPRRKGTNTGALDLAKIADLRRFTARTANDISIPVTVDQIPGESAFRVSSFPHIAGMMVITRSSLNVTSANAVVSESLFGRIPNGAPIMDIIPGFDRMLNLLVEEDQVDLIEGMVIPEHSFRRARAMLALREGKADAAAVFLRPSGVPAIHRDGAEIMIDVQMRVVKSESLGQTYSDRIITESDEEGPDAPDSEIVYALWVTYSRTLHAVNHGVGPISPLVSRPSTPPKQPQPNEMAPVAVHPDSDSDDAPETGSKKPETTTSEAKQGDGEPPAKKSINDFVILEDMGAGAYGQVKLARPKSSIDAPKVVIKYVTKRRILVDTWTRDRRLGTVPLEIHVLDYLRRDGYKHPNIVEMSDFFEDDINYYIEMVPHGLPGMDLFDYIELRVNMEEDECRRIFRQVASAVEFLHLKAKVVHRDIKDENVVLDGEGNIKLIDFGSAAYIKSGPFDVFVGTIDYAAPEVLAGSSYNGKEQDVWALGILLYTILYKENPFYSIDEIMDHDLRVPYVVSEGSIDLVRKMLNRVVENRYTIQDVTGHPWCAAADT